MFESAENARFHKHCEAGDSPASQCLCGNQNTIGLVAFQQIMAAFAADSAFDQAVALRATLCSQGNFSLRAGSDHHFKSFLELFRQRPGSNERGKLAKGRGNLKRLTRSACRLAPDSILLPLREGGRRPDEGLNRQKSIDCPMESRTPAHTQREWEESQTTTDSGSTTSPRKMCDFVAVRLTSS